MRGLQSSRLRNFPFRRFVRHVGYPILPKSQKYWIVVRAIQNGGHSPLLRRYSWDRTSTMSGRGFSGSPFSVELDNSFSFEIFTCSLISWNKLSTMKANPLSLLHHFLFISLACLISPWLKPGDLRRIRQRFGLTTKYE